MTIDRRKEMRIPLVLPVGCHGFGDEVTDLPKFDLSCYDLSSHGMALECESPIGTDETCRFSLPFFHSEEPLTVKGKVQWHKNLRDRNKIGIRFEEPIDLPLPFPIVEDAAARVRQDVEFYKSSLRNVLSDACIWINGDGEILQYDQRALHFLDVTDLELRGKRISDFILPEDRSAVEGILKNLRTNSDVAPTTCTVRLRPRGKIERFCQVSVVTMPPWSGAVEVYLRDVTQTQRLEHRNRLLTEMISRMSGNMDGTLLVLAPNLQIEDILGGVPEGRVPKAGRRFKGTAFHEATGLGDVEVKGKTVRTRLESCVKTGKAIVDLPVTYWGRADKGEDLFSAGDLRLTVTPLLDSEKRVSALILFAKAAKGARELERFTSNGNGRFESILGASAAGFLLEHCLQEVWHPMTGLLAQLDLLLYKSASAEGDNGTFQPPSEDAYAADRARIQQMAGDLSDQVKSALSTLLPVGRGMQVDRNDVQTCLPRAITLLGGGAGTADGRILFTSARDLPALNVDGDELVVILLIFLLLSKSCLAHVSDKTIRCEATRDGHRVKVAISHNGYIQEEAYLKILFSPSPLKGYFSEAGSVKPMETLLHHVSFLLKKHHITMKLVNIPGQFELSLSVPAVISST